MLKLNQEEVFIRPFQNMDAEMVFDFFQALSQSTRYFFHPYSFTQEEAEKFTGEDLLNLNTRRYMAVVKEHGIEKMVGHVFFGEWLKKVPWLGIAVRDGYQGKGLGKMLMKYAIGEAEEHNKGGVLLITKVDNTSAQTLYKQCGFEIIGKDPNGEFLMLLNFSEDRLFPITR